MSTDLRDLFHSTVLVPPPDLLDVDRAIRLGRRRRRTRVAATLTAAGAVFVAAGLAVAGSIGGGQDGEPATTVSPTPSPSPTAVIPRVLPATAARSPLIRVESGDRVDIGAGAYLTMTPREKCVVVPEAGAPPQPRCKSLTDGNQSRGSVSLQIVDIEATWVTGIYTGTDAVKIVIRSKGKSYLASIVKLAPGKHDLAYFLTVGHGTLDMASDDGVTVTAYDKRGNVISE